MYVYIYICMYTCIHTHIYICVCVYIQICTILQWVYEDSELGAHTRGSWEVVWILALEGRTRPMQGTADDKYPAPYIPNPRSTGRTSNSR